MSRKPVKTIKIPYSSGWVLVETRTAKIMAHSRTFQEIVVKAKEFKPSNTQIFSVSRNYSGNLMNAI